MKWSHLKNDSTRGMASKAKVNSILVLRVLTLLLLAASVVVLATNNIKFGDGSKFSFSDIHAYRYVIAVAAAGFLYSLIQLPFAIYHAATEKRWIKNGWLPEFDFFGDKLFSWLLASGAGAGFGITVEIQRFLNPTFDGLEQATGQDLSDERSKAKNFFNRVDIATGLLVGGFLTLAITSILTSRKKSEKGGFFK